MDHPSDPSIRTRLTRFMVLVTGGALLCMAVGFLSYEYLALRGALLRNTRAQVQVVATSSDAALAFGDKAEAEKVLAAIAVDRQIRLACIFDHAGNRFAAYPPDTGPQVLPESRGADHRFGPGILEVSGPISAHDQDLGTVFIRTDLGEIRSRLALTVGVLLAMWLVIFTGVFLASFALQKQISDPLLALSEAARKISQDKDYSTRLVRGQGGEIGVLTASLNNMLTEIQARDAQLVNYQDHLEDQVAQRSEQLLKLNTQLMLEKERAEEANRTKSAFLANMSHELRTPLNAILLYSEVLIDEVTDRGAEVLVPDLHKIQSAGRHLLSLIDDILDLSKIEAGRMNLYVEEVDIPALLDNITTMLEPLVARNHNRFERNADPAITVLRTDHKRLKQTLFNLLDNASKFTKAGKVSLTLQAVPGGEWVEFVVQDTGIGMSPAQAERVFKEFIQADDSTTRRFGGTGLGLSLARRFAEMLGGSIRLESVEGVGSTFTLTLPRSVEPLEPSAFEPVKDEPRSHRGKVLIIDDDPAMREAVSRTLTRVGFWAVGAGSGEEGLRLARSIKPDVITLDIAMPGMDGWQVLTVLKGEPELQPIPVVLITMMDGRERGYALGAADYLQKPVPRDTLLQALEKYAREKTAGPVLVVEDDPGSREGLEQILQAEGWNTLTAGDGLEALEQLGRTPLSLILLDLMMPHMDGFKLITEMQDHSEWNRIPVIVLTARDLSAADLERLQAPQVQRVMKKGAFSKEYLINSVRELTLRCVAEPADEKGQAQS